MNCPKCKCEMEIDSSEGLAYSECTHYICTNEECDFGGMSIWENGEVFINEKEQYMKLICPECRELGDYFKDEKLEARGYYSFRCICGEEYLAPIDNPMIVNENKNHILGLDIAKETSDNSCIRIGFVNTCIEEMQELWNIGDEYPLPEIHRVKLGLKDHHKLIISSIYENDDKSVIFMNMLVKSINNEGE